MGKVICKRASNRIKNIAKAGKIQSNLIELEMIGGKSFTKAKKLVKEALAK